MVSLFWLVCLEKQAARNLNWRGGFRWEFSGGWWRRGGGSEKGNIEEFFKLVSYTDPRSIVEVDYKKEIEQDLPLSLNKVENEKVFIYGENDKLRGTTDSLIGNYITVPGGTHNTFRSNPLGTLGAVRSAL